MIYGMEHFSVSVGHLGILKKLNNNLSNATTATQIPNQKPSLKTTTTKKQKNTSNSNND